MISEHLVHGLYTDVRTYLHPSDKGLKPCPVTGRMQTGLHSYKRATLPLWRWVDCHKAGYAFVHGDMHSYVNDWGRETYSHRKSLWRGTDWIVLDLDSDVITTHDASQIHLIDPAVDDYLYAICESLSSNVDGRPARWHGFVHLERAFTQSETHLYTAFLYGLQRELRTMTGAERQPAQPVYGNGRPNAYAALPENTLSIQQIDTLIAKGLELYPQLAKATPLANTAGSAGMGYARPITHSLRKDYTDIQPAALRQFLTDYAVPIYTGSKQFAQYRLYYLPCPFRAHHSKDVALTDAYLRIDTDGTWGFRCFHDSCNKRIAEAKATDETASGWKVFSDAIRCPVRSDLKRIGITPKQVRHTAEARVYDAVPCPRDASHRGTALFRKTDSQRIFRCSSADCAPIAWNDFIRLTHELGVPQ